MALTANMLCAALSIVKVDVGILNPIDEVKVLMESCIGDAYDALLGAGIILDNNSISDVMLLSRYAAWLYRSRATGSAMPDMLRSQIRNRQVRNATEACADDI